MLTTELAGADRKQMASIERVVLMTLQNAVTFDDERHGDSETQAMAT